jgi:radical SAM protein with 4Fe4S-binding SPASM domain
MSRFRVIEFQLLQACNASCLYCAYEQNIAKHDKWLPLDIVDRTLAEERPEWVWFEGGEVTISDASKEYLVEAMKIAGRYGVKNRINTNCQNVGREWAVRLASAGLRYACVSFDSINTALYCKLRGFPESAGAEKLEQLKKNAMFLADAGVTVNLEATVTRYNIHELESLYDYAESMAINSRDIIMGAQCLVATYDEIFDLYPSIDEMAQTFKRLTDRAKKGKIPVRICCPPLIPCRYEEMYEPHPNVIWVQCSCGHDYVHVHANGDVHLCGFWDHTEPIGNLKEKSLREIWNTSLLRKQAMEDVPEECTGCRNWDGPSRCHNTCFSIAHRKTGTFRTFSYNVTVTSVINAHAGVV